eukprot:Opistho-2@36057
MAENVQVKIGNQLLGVFVRTADRLFGFARERPAEAAGHGKRNSGDGRCRALVKAVLGVSGAHLHAHGPLEHVAHDGRVGPRMLHVQSALSVRKHNERKRLVKPAVAAVAVDQAASHFGEIARLLLVHYENEHGSVDGTQRVAVDAGAKVAQARLGPRGAVLSSECGNRRLSSGGSVAVGVVDNPLDLAFKFEGGERGSIGAEALQAVEGAVAENNNVLAFVFRVVLHSVELVSREAGGRKHALVLAHAHGDRVADEHGLQGFAIEHLLELKHLGDDVGGAGDGNWRWDKLVRVNDVVVAVDHDGRAAHEVAVFLPPVRHVVGGNPRLECEVALELGTFVAEKVLALFGDLGILVIREQRTDG